jgi:hypothetical protein
VDAKELLRLMDELFHIHHYKRPDRFWGTCQVLCSLIFDH